MSLQQIPCGEFKVNDLILRQAGLAFNLIMNIGQQTMSVIENTGISGENPVDAYVFCRSVGLYMRVDCKLVRRAGQITVKFGEKLP